MTKKFNIAIVGATGMVGATTLEILEKRKFPINKLFLLASKRSAGESRNFNNIPHTIEDLSEFDFKQSEICFFCTSNEISKNYVPKATSAGNIVIDKSSTYRYDPAVPLVIPEVNGEDIAKYTNKKILANPNCAATPIVLALKPLYDAVGIKRINIATYQSVSGSGSEGVNELAEQTAHLVYGKPVATKFYSHQIAFNLIPVIDDIQDNGYTKEEMKIVWEIQKILNDATIAINPTAVRVPVFYGHSAAVHVETKQKITVQQLTQLLQQTPGIELSKGNGAHPTPVSDAAGKDAVFVGRIREDISHPNGISFWVVTDNLRKGASLNAIQMAEILAAKYLAK